MRSSPAEFSGEKKFSVRLEGLGSVLECREAEIVGPGFLSNLPISTRLLPGQVRQTLLFIDLLSFLLSSFQLVKSVVNL